MLIELINPKPSEKSPEITRFLDATFNRTESIKKCKCTFCKADVKQFRDLLSIKEYGISGLCQDCQDKTFGK